MCGVQTLNVMNTKTGADMRQVDRSVEGEASVVHYTQSHLLTVCTRRIRVIPDMLLLHGLEADENIPVASAKH